MDVTLKNLKDTSNLSTNFDVDPNSVRDTLHESKSIEPSNPQKSMDSVTAVLAVQKLAAGSQSSTKLKHLSRSLKTTSREYY